MRIPCAAVLGAALLLPAPAGADCALPAAFRFVLDPPGDVQIHLQSSAGRTCPDQGLLRLDVTSGDIIEITACLGEAFLDECVPAGSYQYGLAVPYDCEASACFTRYYDTLDVVGPSGACTPGGPAPAPAASVPWSTRQDVCTYRGSSGESGCGCGLDPRGAVLGTDLAFLLAGLSLWRWRPGRRRPRA